MPGAAKKKSLLPATKGNVETGGEGAPAADQKLAFRVTPHILGSV